MAPPNFFYIKQNATRPVLILRLERADGTVVDLTTATSVRLQVDDPLTLDVAMTVTDAVNGIVEYDWKAGEIDTVGKHRADVEVVWDDGGVEAFPADGYLWIVVDEDV